MLLSQIKKLRELRSRYASDIALIEQNGQSFPKENTKDALLTLSLLHFNRQLTDLIHEYFETNGDDAYAFVLAVRVLEGAVGGISGIKHSDNPTLVQRAFELGQESRQTEFEYYARGKHEKRN